MIPFDKALAFVLKVEGGYANLAGDSGGMTNLGVTHATWEAWSHKPATEAVMRALTPADVYPLYRTQFWMPINGDSLPHGLGLAVFDFAVNGGVSRAAKMLEQLVGEKQDGWIGAGTLVSVSKYVARSTVADAIRDFVGLRRGFYRSCEDFPRFGRGWLERCDLVEAAALDAA